MTPAMGGSRQSPHFRGLSDDLVVLPLLYVCATKELSSPCDQTSASVSVSSTVSPQKSVQVIPLAAHNGKAGFIDPGSYPAGWQQGGHPSSVEADVAFGAEIPCTMLIAECLVDSHARIWDWYSLVGSALA